MLARRATRRVARAGGRRPKRPELARSVRGEPCIALCFRDRRLFRDRPRHGYLSVHRDVPASRYFCRDGGGGHSSVGDANQLSRRPAPRAAQNTIRALTMAVAMQCNGMQCNGIQYVWQDTIYALTGWKPPLVLKFVRAPSKVRDRVMMHRDAGMRVSTDASPP